MPSFGGKVVETSATDELFVQSGQRCCLCVIKREIEVDNVFFLAFELVGSYTFTGWSPAVGPISGNTTYTAQFSSVVNTYTVSFTTPGGGTLSQASILNVPYGSQITTPDLDAIAINGITVTANNGNVTINSTTSTTNIPYVLKGLLYS